MPLKGLLMQTSISWHFDVHPAGIIRASHLFWTSLLSTSSVLSVENASYVNNEFSKPISLETFLMYFNLEYHQAILSWDARLSMPLLGILPQIPPVFAVSQYVFFGFAFENFHWRKHGSVCSSWQNYGNVLFLTTWYSHHTLFGTSFSDAFADRKRRCLVYVRNKWYRIFTDPHVATSIGIEFIMLVYYWLYFSWKPWTRPSFDSFFYNNGRMVIS